MRSLVTALAGAAIALAAGWFWRRWRAAQLAARRRLAMWEFLERRSEITGQFKDAAARLGKPRGLTWERCDFQDAVKFARDRTTGELFALVGVTIAFSATAGGGMEDVEAVGNLRCATAVFVHRGSAWTTDGRTLFNLEPHEALVQFAETLEPQMLAPESL
jgi:hypothetical protein